MSHMSVDLFDVDNPIDMLNHAVTALRVTDVEREDPRHHPAGGDYSAFTSQRAAGNIGAVRVHITAFTHEQATP